MLHSELWVPSAKEKRGRQKDGEKSSAGCVNGVQHFTGAKLVGLRLEQRGDQGWSKSVRMDDHMLVDKMIAEKTKVDPTTISKRNNTRLWYGLSRK